MTEPTQRFCKECVLLALRWLKRLWSICDQQARHKRLRTVQEGRAAANMGGKRAAAGNGLQHPQGVQPWGNYLFAQGRDTRNEGT